MKALILLGGLGTRLRPFTLAKPKPLLPFLNRPFFSYQLDQLKKHGVRDVVLALGHQAAHFKKHLGNGRAWGMRFVYSMEKKPLGTGGAIRNALSHLKGTTIVLNGDIMSNVDITAMHRFHKAKKSQGTLALAPVSNPTIFGLIETDRKGKISSFVEKPSEEELTTNTINAGYYIFELPLIRAIPANQVVSIERDVFPHLIDGEGLYGYLHKGYWSDIGTLRSYWLTHMQLLDTYAPPKGSGIKKVRDGFWVGKNARLHNVIKVQGKALIGDKCRVAANVIFRGGVSVGAGCAIGENTRLTDCVIHPGTRIGANTRLENCVIGEKCVIGDHCHVGPNQVMANRSVLGDYSQSVSGLLMGEGDS